MCIPHQNLPSVYAEALQLITDSWQPLTDSSHACQVTAGIQRYVSQLVTWEASEAICF